MYIHVYITLLKCILRGECEMVQIAFNKETELFSLLTLDMVGVFEDLILGFTRESLDTV